MASSIRAARWTQGIGWLLLGGFLIWRATRTQPPGSLRLERRLLLQRPREEVWRFLRDFTRLPSWVGVIRSVEPLSPWTARIRWSQPPARPQEPTTLREGEIELVEEKENELLVWRSTAGLPIDLQVEIQLMDSSAPGGTDLVICLSAQKITRRPKGESPADELGSALGRLKKLMEPSALPRFRGTAAVVAH